MATKRSFEHYIRPDDRVDIELAIDRGRVTDLTVNLRSRIDDRWVEVARYDTAHGHLHLHRFWRPEDDRIETLEDPDDPQGTDDTALGRAEQDLLDNWRTYRRRMEANLG